MPTNAVLCCRSHRQPDHRGCCVFFDLRRCILGTVDSVWWTMTGLRKGELFALNWSAVNLSEGVLVVRRTLQELNGLSLKEPKTKAGKRMVSLGSEALDALKMQANESARRRL